MKIKDGPTPGMYHCCDCGSMQRQFDSIEHASVCTGIKSDQQFTHCPWHDKDETLSAFRSIINAIDSTP